MEQLTWMFKELGWPKKFLYGLFHLYIPILDFAIPGYLVAIVRNFRNNAVPKLPEWDRRGEYILDGGAVLIAELIYGIPALLLVGAFTPSQPSYTAYSQTPSSTAAQSLVAFFGGVWAIVVFSCLVVWMHGVIVNYAVNPSFTAFFNLVRIPQIIAQGWRRILGTLITFVVLGSFMAIPCLNIIIGGPLLLYLQLVFAYNCGQIAQTAQITRISPPPELPLSDPPAPKPTSGAKADGKKKADFFDD